MNYLLGGEDNLTVDRELVAKAFGPLPGGGEAARAHAEANRAFVARVVRWLAGEGVRQYLDLGAGIPTPGHPDTHQLAPAGARTLYVDHDPFALTHAHTRRQGTRTNYLDADIRDGDRILTVARHALDLTAPVALLLAAVLHHITDDNFDAVDAVIRALPPGSYVVITHISADHCPDIGDAAQALSRAMAVPVIPRTAVDIAGLLNDLDPVEPHVAPIHEWHRGPGSGPAPAAPALIAAVARKP